MKLSRIKGESVVGEKDTVEPPGSAHASDPMLMGVAGRCAITREGRLLLLQRPHGDGFDPGAWELPGGKAGSGETLIEAVAREVVEETALVVSVGRPYAVWHFVKLPYWVTGVGFLCNGWKGNVTLSEEHERFVWATMEEASSLPLARGTAEQLDALAALGPAAWA